MQLDYNDDVVAAKDALGRFTLPVALTVKSFASSPTFPNHVPLSDRDVATCHPVPSDAVEVGVSTRS